MHPSWPLQAKNTRHIKCRLGFLSNGTAWRNEREPTDTRTSHETSGNIATALSPLTLGPSEPLELPALCHVLLSNRANSSKELTVTRAWAQAAHEISNTNTTAKGNEDSDGPMCLILGHQRNRHGGSLG